MTTTHLCKEAISKVLIREAKKSKFGPMSNLLKLSERLLLVNVPCQKSAGIYTLAVNDQYDCKNPARVVPLQTTK